ncbi:hypothetical protein AAG747_00850 [Rapidithrix thailandica]|uniref:Uncharacterized protein n=1 Tax=Rapidithrix thailandica TaxID=413964 RepID=A0AAW9S227_9BACT
MKASGKTVLNFLADNYIFIEQVFGIAKSNNFFIPHEILEAKCLQFEIAIEKLASYRIVQVLGDGNYELNKRFSDFLAFLLDDFRLDLPESIKKYQQSIAQIFTQLCETEETSKQEDLANGLVSEIQEFTLQIHANTHSLYDQAMELKSNKKQIDYVDKVKKAGHLVKNYIKPLNDILNKEDPQALIRQLYKVSDFANLQRHNVQDLLLRKQFEKLYQHVAYANEEILKNIALITKELTPLLERIRTESLVLTGVNEILLKARKGKIDWKVGLQRGKRPGVYASNFELDVKVLVENAFRQQPMIIIPDGVADDNWIFDKDAYKEVLLQQLPVKNFFQWCFEQLQKEEADLKAEKFYILSALLFEKEIRAEFQKTEKFTIDLADYELQVPVVSVEVNPSTQEN